MTRLAFGFTGTRNGMTRRQERALTELLQGVYCNVPPSEFHHGDCVGADEEAHDITQNIGFVTVAHPPDDDSHRAHCVADQVREAKPYLLRNQDIVDETGRLIACPSHGETMLGSGTWATIRRARRAKKWITIIWPNGYTEHENKPEVRS